MASTVRTFLRRALERTQAIGIGAYISNDEINNALYELNLLVSNSSILDRSLFTKRNQYSTTTNGASISFVASGSPSAGVIVSPVIPTFLESVLCKRSGETVWLSLDLVPMANRGMIGEDVTVDTPEQFYYVSPVAVGDAGILMLYPAPDGEYEIKVNTTIETAELELDDTLPFNSVYEEYFLYLLASALSVSLGTDPAPSAMRANQILAKIKRITQKNVVSERIVTEYDLMTNSGG